VEEMKGDVLRAMAMVAVDRSGGKLEVFSGKYFVTDELLKYIGDRCLYFLLPFRISRFLIYIQSRIISGDLLVFLLQAE
jgi:hypothetical protein